MVQIENGPSDDNGADRPLSYADLVRWFVIVGLVALGVAVAIAIKETLLLFAIAFLIAIGSQSRSRLTRAARFETRARCRASHRSTFCHIGSGRLFGCPAVF